MFSNALMQFLITAIQLLLITLLVISIYAAFVLIFSKLMKKTMAEIHAVAMEWLEDSYIYITIGEAINRIARAIARSIGSIATGIALFIEMFFVTIAAVVTWPIDWVNSKLLRYTERNRTDDFEYTQRRAEEALKRLEERNEQRARMLEIKRRFREAKERKYLPPPNGNNLQNIVPDEIILDHIEGYKFRCTYNHGNDAVYWKVGENVAQLVWEKCPEDVRIKTAWDVEYGGSNKLTTKLQIAIDAYFET